MESSGAILHAPDAVYCALLHARVRKCECLRRGPWLDRAYSQARGVLFGRFRLILDYMLVFL